MFVNYFVEGRTWSRRYGRWSYEACDILVFDLTDCVWMVPGTFE